MKAAGRTPGPRFDDPDGAYALRLQQLREQALWRLLNRQHELVKRFTEDPR